MDFKILSITSAHYGWVARSKSNDPPPIIDLSPVVVWAVIEDEKGQRVVGLVQKLFYGSLYHIENDPGFIGYSRTYENEE
jgi:hypothetical protein